MDLLAKLVNCGSLPLLRLFDPLAKLFNLVGMGADFIFTLGWLDVAHLFSPLLNVLCFDIHNEITFGLTSLGAYGRGLLYF